MSQAQYSCAQHTLGVGIYSNTKARETTSLYLDGQENTNIYAEIWRKINTNRTREV